jgi:quercetin dioxygenase-like cupin family protein
LAQEVPSMPEPVLFFADLAAEAPPVGRGIHSQTLYDGPDLRLVLFAFAAGEELSEHTAARAAVVHVLDGEGEAVVGVEPHPIGPGAWFRMPARMPHSIRARTPLRLALYLLAAED